MNTLEYSGPLPWRPLLAEFIGTALLLAAIVGSGIMAQTESPSDPGLQLLEAALATGFVLSGLIITLGPVSGAHFNPVVSVADWLLGGRELRVVASYVAVQILGGAVGVVLANLMFDGDPVSISDNARTGVGRWLGEVVATYGLVVTIFMMVRTKQSLGAIAAAVGAYIAGAHFFTSSSSFANPAVTLARTLSDTFAGIMPGHVLGYLLAQLLGAGLGVLTVAALAPSSGSPSDLDP